MKEEFHRQAFEERKETIFRWAIDVRGIENSQRTIGDNSSKAICELLCAYLHKEKKVETGFQLNHSWFQSDKVFEQLPEFDSSKKIVTQMIALERLCEQLSYGSPKPLGKLREALELVKNHPSIDGWHDVTTSCAFLSTQNSTGLRDQWNICCFKSLEKELRAMLRW